MRRRIRLTESDLHRIVRNTVRRVMREGLETGGGIGGWNARRYYKDELDAYEKDPYNHVGTPMGRKYQEGVRKHMQRQLERSKHPDDPLAMKRPWG